MLYFDSACPCFKIANLGYFLTSLVSMFISFKYKSIATISLPVQTKTLHAIVVFFPSLSLNSYIIKNGFESIICTPDVRCVFCFRSY